MSTLEELCRKFDPAIFKFNQQGHVYITVQHFISRLTDTMGPAWGSTTKESSLQLSPNKTQSGKAQWVASAAVDVWVRIDDYTITRTGWGGDENFDPNTAMKTAGAEAFKKACNQLGIGFYLLGKDNPEREIHEFHNSYLNGGQIEDLKKAVAKAARVDGYDGPLDASMSKFFNVKPADLQDAQKLDEILRSRF